MTFNGYTYTKKSTAASGNHAFYQCRSYRAPHFSKAQLKYERCGVITEKETTHAFSQNGKTKSVSVGGITNVQEEMKQVIVDSCIEDATKSATEVAKSSCQNAR